MTHKVVYDSEDIPTTTRDGVLVPDFTLMVEMIREKGGYDADIQRALETAYGYGYYSGKEYGWWKDIEDDLSD